MLLAEELLLLLLDEEKGTVSATAADAGLAGALLLDLAGVRALWTSGGARAGSEPSEPALAAAWRAIDEPKPAKHWVAKLPGRLKPIKGTVAEALVARGVLDEQRHKTLGLFSSTRYPELDSGPETELRARLRSVLVDGAEPDARDDGAARPARAAGSREAGGGARRAQGRELAREGAGGARPGRRRGSSCRPGRDHDGGDGRR